MECLIPFSGKKEKTIVNFSSSVCPESAGLGGSAGCASDWISRGCGFHPAGSATFFRGDYHELFYTVILPFR